MYEILPETNELVGLEVTAESLEVEVVAVDRALVDALTLRLCVGDVADKTVVVNTDVAGAVVDNRLKELCRSTLEDGLLFCVVGKMGFCSASSGRYLIISSIPQALITPTEASLGSSEPSVKSKSQ